MKSARVWLLVSLPGLALACASVPWRHIRPVDSRDLAGVVMLPFASSQVESFFDARGRPCPPFEGAIVDFFAGWQSHDADPACDHDTFDDGLHSASLELHWQGSVPVDGAVDLVSGGYAIGAWGRAVARGSHYGNYVAWARVVLEVVSPHCRGEWASPLARAAVTGSFSRQVEFTGWSEVPDLHLAGCKAGDPLDVRVRLMADSNRGRIEIDAFGFSAVAGDDIDHVFGVRPARAAR